MNISAREKKFLVVGGSIVTMGTILYVSLSLIPSGAGLSTTVDFKKRMLLKQKETVIQENEFKTRAEQYRQRLDQNMSLLLPYPNPSIAAAELQRILKEMADQSGVEIIRKDIVQQRDQKAQDNLLKVSVRIETNCLPEHLVQLLAAIENYEKYLAVEDLSINSFRIQKRYEIRPSITVSGYIAAPQAKPVQRAAGGV
jgi:hypothetical protein